jgi:hypothetical protein
MTVGRARLRRGARDPDLGITPDRQEPVKITSEHVARVSDVDTTADGVPYMVMEYLEGGDLGMTKRSDRPRRGSLPTNWRRIPAQANRRPAGPLNCMNCPSYGLTDVKFTRLTNLDWFSLPAPKNM